jgi:hypothetical protein
VRQEGLPVDGQLGAARRAGEQRHPEVLFSAAIRLDTACCVIDRSVAASENWPASAAATNVRTASRSTPTDPKAPGHNAELWRAGRAVV